MLRTVPDDGLAGRPLLVSLVYSTSEGSTSLGGVQLSSSVEDYLKTIWKLGSRGDRVTLTAVAGARAVSPPSASAMLHRLEEAALVERGPAAEVYLTPLGRVEALRVVRRHRLLEAFLTQVCGLHWDEVHDEAEVLEHALSARLEARIDELLGHPSRDPHGDPIPLPEAAQLEEDWHEPLQGTPEGAAFRVERVSDRDPAALRHVATVGVVPGVTLRVGRQDPFGGPLWVSVQDAADLIPLAPGLVEIVYGRVTPFPDPGAGVTVAVDAPTSEHPNGVSVVEGDRRVSAAVG